MSGFKVSPDQLQALGAQCGSTAAGVRESHAGLRGQLAPIMGADWSGAAAARFAELFGQFEASAASLTQALDGIGQLLANAGRSYADVEQAIAGSFLV